MYQVEKKFDYDVIVCGGGTAGVAAAIASARVGASTLLIERLGALGGQMNVSGPPGFAYARLFNNFGEQIIGGIIEETHARLLAEGHAEPHNKFIYRKYSSYSFSYIDPEWWGLLIYDMMVENNVDLLLHSLVVDVVKEGDRVTGVVVENANGRLTFNAKVVIECTGEGDIAARAGCECEEIAREEIQPHSLAFTADGVDWDKVLAFVHEHSEEVRTIQAERLPEGKKRPPEDSQEMIKRMNDPLDFGEIMGFPSLVKMGRETGEWHEYSGIGFFMTPKGNGVVEAHFQHSAQIPKLMSYDAWDLTAAEVELRRQIRIAFTFFKKHFPGFENAYIVKICPEVRLRDGRRVVGDYMLTTEDIRDSARFYDVIGLNSMVSGGHHVASNETLTTTSTPNAVGGSNDIPYRVLVPKKIENLLVAGKHVSATRDAYMRFLMQTMVTGQAAGAAAALCVKKGVTPRELEAPEHIKELQEILLSQGVILGGVH
ncbi:MAG: FAD-dependent oxidoreductase [Anaerolineaceae bacterium]